MTKTLFTLLAAASALTLTACMEEQRATDMAPGKYEKTTTSKDAAGTKYKSEQETEVMYDEYGNKKAVVKSKTTKDPKGLMNKSSTESKTVIEQDRY